MIIRRGMGNVRYTHDAEAAFEALRAARALAHVSDNDLAHLIDECGAFAPDYWTNEDASDFLPVATYGWRLESWMRRVPLHNMDHLAEQALERFGFRCIACHRATPNERGQMRLLDWPVLLAALDRQGLSSGGAPVCGDCATGINAVFRPVPLDKINEPRLLVDAWLRDVIERSWQHMQAAA